MDQVRDLADARLIDGCVYCGGLPNTRDHVPSKVLLDRPLPENLPILPACLDCNNGFSPDEEYVACLLGAAMVGSADPDKVQRPGVASILRRNAALRARLERAKRSVEGQVVFDVEPARVENVLLKLARGHAAFELSKPCRERPTRFAWGMIAALPVDARESLDEAYVTDLLGEVGSRGAQRMLVAQLPLVGPEGQTETISLLVIDWVDVQEGSYRYLAYEDEQGIRVRIIIGEYLYADVLWGDTAGDA